jgi:Calcineurin-like phosphoesterase
MYDLIGDIHGHADKLVELLERLDYRKIRGIYRHPDRKVIFLGDYIDRGPDIPQVISIVRGMVEENEALAIMGNHELNALAFHTEDPARLGTFLRKRNTANIRQHGQTIVQLDDQQLQSALNWFRTLPLWLDLDGLRAVHACWDESAMGMITRAIEGHGGITTDFLQSAYQIGSELFSPVEVVLKGKEAKLPPHISVTDNDGHPRTKVRTRWYLPPQGQTFRTYALQSEELDFDMAIDESIAHKASPYPSSAKPVFVGHYCLTTSFPSVLAENVACLDFGVAKGGFLCAYRWNGEQKLCNDNFVRTR